MIKLVLVGTGNVSKAIAKAVLENDNIQLVRVIGRKNVLDTNYPNPPSYATNLKDLPECDLILITVQDQMIQEVSEMLVSNQAVVTHTSGASDTNLLATHKHRGVFYPLQTFSKNSQLDWKSIPVCWEAHTTKAEKMIQSFGELLGVSTMLSLDLQKRTVLHLTAVMVNNFGNSLFQLSHQLLQKNQLDFEILKPLILETAKKIKDQTPLESQTGPARRGDMDTIEKHISILEDKTLIKLYKTFTNQLLTTYNHEKL